MTKNTLRRLTLALTLAALTVPMCTAVGQQVTSGTDPEPTVTSGTDPEPTVTSGTDPEPTVTSGTDPEPDSVDAILALLGLE